MGLDAINLIRKKKGMGLEELSVKSGVPIGTLSKISAGITKDPKLETMKAIARALNCSLDDFDDASPPSQLSEEEIDIISKFRSLDTYRKLAVLNCLNFEYQNNT